MATSSKTATFKFADGDEYDLTFSPFNPASTASFKANVQQFNATSISAISDTFISSAGAALTSISAAKFVTTERTTFYTR